MNGRGRTKVIDFDSQRSESGDRSGGPYSNVPMDLSPILRDMVSYGRKCFNRGSIQSLDYASYVLSQLQSSVSDPDRMRENIAKFSHELRRMRNDALSSMYNENDD